MTDYQIKTRNNTKTKLAVDLVIFIGFLIAMDPRSSGIAIHEWLAAALLGGLVMHLLLSWDWIVQVTRRFFGRTNKQARINYMLNWLLFLDGTLLMLSGFMISESLLPSLGISLTKNFAYRSLHDLSANLFLLLLGMHTALHWSWIVDVSKRYVFQPVSRLFSPGSRKDVTA